MAPVASTAVRYGMLHYNVISNIGYFAPEISWSIFRGIQWVYEGGQYLISAATEYLVSSLTTNRFTSLSELKSFNTIEKNLDEGCLLKKNSQQTALVSLPTTRRLALLNELEALNTIGGDSFQKKIITTEEVD